MAKRSPTRRGRRRLRVTVAAVLLTSATAITVAAMLIQTTTWLMAAAAVALVCGFAATRIVHTEMLQNRRDNAAARARQANAYRQLFAERAQENVAFAGAMAGRVARRDRTIGELEGTIRLADRRADLAEKTVKAERLRADDAAELLSNLQRRLEISDPELIDELAVWEGAELDTVIDLLHWEERVIATQSDAAAHDEKQA